MITAWEQWQSKNEAPEITSQKLFIWKQIWIGKDKKGKEKYPFLAKDKRFISEYLSIETYFPMQYYPRNYP